MAKRTGDGCGGGFVEGCMVRRKYRQGGQRTIITAASLGCSGQVDRQMLQGQERTHDLGGYSRGWRVESGEIGLSKLRRRCVLNERAEACVWVPLIRSSPIEGGGDRAEVETVLTPIPLTSTRRKHQPRSSWHWTQLI
jgi:hypothetical protein